jgi:hypothetical protein
MGTTDPMVFYKVKTYTLTSKETKIIQMTLGLHLTLLFFQKILQLLEAKFRNWWKDDVHTMLIIERRITQVQLGLLSSEPGTTARHCWNKLKNLYGCLDVHAQFTLMDKVSNLQLVP